MHYKVIYLLLSLFLWQGQSYSCSSVYNSQEIKKIAQKHGSLEKFVALTFDDGPFYHTTSQILEVLDEWHVKATFFVIGKNVKKWPSIFRETVDKGHEIANHSYNHKFMSKLAPEKQKEEIDLTEEVIDHTIDRDYKVTWFRPPYGASNNSLTRVASSIGLHSILWSIDPKDWANPKPAVIVQRVLKNLHPGGVILLHDNHLNTVKALPTLLKELKARQYKVLTLSEWYAKICPN